MEPTAHNDRDLLRAARLGDPECFGAFFRQHHAVVLAFLARRVGEPEVAADMLAETFAALLTVVRDPRRELPASPVGWLLVTARNLLIDRHRHPATLGSSIMPGVHGVHLNYIRLLPPAPGFPHQLLYTATSGDLGVGNPPVVADPATEARNLICVQQVEASGVGGDCTETSVLTSGDWRESAGLDGYGLVPDGVATVVLHYPDHPAQTERVTDNTFSWQGYPAPEGPITHGTPQTEPGPTPEVPASVTWLNANGDVVATFHTR